MENSPKVQCPKCGSESLHADKKGFSGKKAVAGAVLTGGIGLLAGTAGSNKIIITCLNCGNQFRPGDKPKVVRPPAKPIKVNPKVYKVLLNILGSFLALCTLSAILGHYWVASFIFAIITALCFLRASKL